MNHLTNRLSCLLGLIRPDVPFFDIGTDHALIPIALAKRGHRGAITASDIADGPVWRAKDNIAEAGFSDRIEVRKTDGLHGLPIPASCDILIAGMGGELIADILEEAAASVRRRDVRLILQPMTKPEVLFSYLAESGFAPLCQQYVQDAGSEKIYRILVVSYTGTPYPLTVLQRLLGPLCGSDDSPLSLAIAEKEKETAEKRLRGKREGQKDAPEEEELLAALSDYIKIRKHTDNEK